MEGTDRAALWEATAALGLAVAGPRIVVLARCDPNIRGRFGMTILHDLAAARRHVTDAEQVAFATGLLDSGARLDLRDDLLQSTPLGWACRWGRVEMVKLLLERGADAVEAGAEPWARPRSWAEKRGHTSVLELLDGVGRELRDD